MRLTLWVVALLETCDVINNDRHLGRHREEVEIKLEAQQKVIFCALHKKIPQILFSL